MISVWRRIFDLISPQQCVACGRRLSSTETALCLSCNARLPRTGYQFSPLDNDMAAMFWGRMKVEKCAALMFYDSGSMATDIIRSMKYYDRPDVGRLMGGLTADEFLPSGFFEGIDLLVAVPLAPNRLRRRGFNQSAEIALGVSRKTGIEVARGVVSRDKYKESQTKKQRIDRNTNVAGAFHLIDSEAISGKHVLLIDDVATTGATLTACGNELLKAEGTRLSVLTLAVAHYMG